MAGQPTGGASSGSFTGGQVATGSRIRTGRTVGSVRRGLDLVADLTTGAVTLVDEPPFVELGDRLVVPIEAIALSHDRAVPVETDGGEVAQLGTLVAFARLVSIEVLHPHEERQALRSRRQPGDRRRAQVADMEVPGRRWCEPPAHSASLASCGPRPATPTPSARVRRHIDLLQSSA